jgi:Tfp pilus assembly protein PilF
VKTDQWEAALPEVQSAIQHKPTSAQYHLDLAAVYTHLKQVPDATREYEKTLELDPNYFKANLMYGRLLLLEGHPEAARARLSRAVELDPESPEAHGFLAIAYKQLGQTENAERERARAERLKAQPPE